MSRIAERYLADRPYPETPGFKEPTTSREAAAAVRPGATDGREEVFRAILASGSRGLTPDEAAAVVGRRITYVRPRVTELAKAGRIVSTGDRRANETGLKAKSWKVP